MPQRAVGSAVAEPRNPAQLPHTGGCPYCWVGDPSGEADATGVTSVAASTSAGSAAISLPTIAMANMVARKAVPHPGGARADASRQPDGDPTVTLAGSAGRAGRW